MTRQMWYLCALAGLCLIAAPASSLGQEKAAPDLQAVRVEPAPSKLEADVYRALRQATDLELIDTTLEDLCAVIEMKHGIQVEMDLRALEEVGASKDSTVTANLKGIELRSALRLILRQLGLTYVVRDEVLQFTPVEVANTTPMTRVYDVGELIVSQDKNGEPVRDEAALLKLLKETVQPTAWRDTGGSANAIVHRNALVLSAPFPVQEEVADLLGALTRTLKGTGGARSQ